MGHRPATDSVPPPLAEPEPMPIMPRPGMRLGRYQLLTRLAHGGMAEVWIARQHGELGFSRLVALKMMRPDVAEEPSFRSMFLDEASVAARIRHANVVEVLDLGEEGSLVYLAMSYVEGATVAQLQSKWRKKQDASAGLPIGICCRIVADVTAGLHAAHELTDDVGAPLCVVHRDVSPQNVLVGLDGVARLTDFGIAKALGRTTEETEAGQLKGKFSYLSPEQLKKQPLDRRADLFAAGIVLWEMLTGQRLFRGEDAMDTLLNVASKEVPDPREIVQLPDAVAEVVLRCLERDREARFATAAELRAALEEAAASSGCLASAKDVGAVVKELSLARVERFRQAIRAPRSAESEPLQAETTIAEISAAGASMDTTSVRGGLAAASRQRLALFGIALVTGALLALLFFRSNMTPGSTPEPSSSPAALADNAAAVGDTASDAAASASATVRPSASAGATASAVASGSMATSPSVDGKAVAADGSTQPPSAGRPPREPPKRPPKQPPKPKYDNPYGP